MNNKAINEFGFRRMLRIKQIEEGVIFISYEGRIHLLQINSFLHTI